jgi:hypothetical protein
MGHETSGRFGQEIAMRKLRHYICCHRPDLIRLAARPSALQTAHLRRPSPDHLESGVSAAEGPLAPGLGKARDDAFRRRSIGILAGTAQEWLERLETAPVTRSIRIEEDRGTCDRGRNA